MVAHAAEQVVAAASCNIYKMRQMTALCKCVYVYANVRFYSSLIPLDVPTDQCTACKTRGKNEIRETVSNSFMYIAKKLVCRVIFRCDVWCMTVLSSYKKK